MCVVGGWYAGKTCSDERLHHLDGGDCVVYVWLLVMSVRGRVWLVVIEGDAVLCGC